MATITEDFCSYEVAKLLKEKGFDIECNTAYYNGSLIDYTLYGFCDGELIYCPTHQMAMKWLREVHKLPINIWYDKEEDTSDDEVWTSEIAIGIPYTIVGSFASYEEACEAALKYCLENLI